MTRQNRWIAAATFVTALVALGVALARLLEPALRYSQNTNQDAQQAIAALWCLSAIAWVWLVLTTTLSVLRRAIPALRSCAHLDLATLPAVRTILDRVAVVSLTAASLVPMFAAPGHAETAASITTSAAPYVRGTTSEAATIAPPHVRGAQRSTTSTTPHRSPAEHDPETSSAAKPRSEQKPVTDPTHPGPTSAPAADNEPSRPHIVTTGESLWLIARDELQHRGESTSNAAIARYWGALIKLNRDHLRSGNPNLIFVGERLELPVST